MNTKPVEAMSIEELRKDLQEACYDYDRVEAEGRDGRNAWSLVWIERRILAVTREIEKHDRRLRQLQGE